MTYEGGWAWVCESCEVGGVSADRPPVCWCCGAPATPVTARTAVDQLRQSIAGYEVVRPW